MSTPSPQPRRIEIYDTTLRDGTQGEGVALSLVDKLKITEHLDALGVDYIEGGYPLSNPKDAAFFAEARKLRLRHTRICAFGMTRRKGMAPRQDPGMAALLDAGAPVITIVGKTWDLHVSEVLGVSQEENLAMIAETLDYCRASGHEVFYDAEHFFDGHRANPDYAMQTLRAALQGGATRLILCDTNGGSGLQDVSAAVAQVVRLVRDTAPQVGIGIHVHNDGGLAVANSITAIRACADNGHAGAIQVQGTINGIGERCGNVDLTTIMAHVILKSRGEWTCLQGEASLKRLTETSRFVYELANLNIPSNQPYVGTSAFAHKGGMHVHAVQRVARSYEHVEPGLVGNTRRILVSELSGASNIAATLGHKFDIADNKAVQRQVLERVQDLEHQGYQFEAAQASFELLLHDVMGRRPVFWRLRQYRCVIYRNDQNTPVTEASVKIEVNGKLEHQVAEGDGPVNALDGAMRKCLQPHYPQLAQVHLRDYKVRVVNPTAESAAKVRVVAEFAVLDGQQGAESDGSRYFATIGVNENIVDASCQALEDAFVYHLIETKTKP